MPPKLDPNDPTFSQRFSKTARARISAQTAATWDASLARDPALLVPVDLQALVVPGTAAIERAGIGIHIPTASEGSAAYGSPPPFTDLPNRVPGVYLHWALPDGLTRARVEAGSEAGELGLRPLPNRWLVMRVDSSRKRRMKSWIVESEKGRTTELRGNSWREERETPKRQQSAFLPEQLTAAAGGDVAWAAVYDSVENRFGMYDNLAGGPAPVAPLTYVVVGWYSVPELDPLHPRALDGSFDEAMRALGWTVDEARLEAARAAAEAQTEAVQTLGLDARELSTAGIDTELQVGGEQVGVPATEVAGGVLESTGDVANKPGAWFPTRSICHGTLHGVHPTGGTRPDPKPTDPAGLAVAMGGSDAEALAALVASRTPDTSAASERLLTAFAYGTLDTLDDPDGVVRLDEELHVRGFASQPGGLTSERVRAGDPLAPPEAPEEAPARGPKRAPPKRREARMDLDRQSYDDVLQQFAEQTRPDPLAEVVDAPRVEPVDRAGPRFFVPETPVLTLQGIGRSLRHGYDGRYDPDERVACRLSGDTVGGYAGLVKGMDMLEKRIEHGGMPPEAQPLLEEAVVTDPFFVEQLTATAVEKSGATAKAAKARLEAERRVTLRAQTVETDAPRLLAASLKEGVDPSPLAVTIWRQAWVPIFLEWQLELELHASLARWSLGELDYVPAGDAAPAETVRITGRSLLTPTGAKTFASQVTQFLDTEHKLDLAGQGGLIDDATEELLRTLATAVDGADVAGATLEGVRQTLLGFDVRARVFDPAGNPVPPPPIAPPKLLRAGRAYFSELRVVDAFGRWLDLPESTRAALLPAESLRAPQGAPPLPPGRIHLAPRVMQPVRLTLTLLDAADDAEPATVDQETGGRNPVAGWLLPDHVDGALELFDQAGDPLGQLRHDALSGGVGWEGAPGRPGAVGAAPAETVPNPHLARFATGIVLRDVNDRAAPQPPGESPLSALLRVVDTTLLTVDPFGHGGTEHFSLLVGRPIAVVRAELRLEVESDLDAHELSPEAYAARAAEYVRLAQQLFEVRLGALTRYDDGLLGYFVDDDYSVFRPVHPVVLDEARPSGPYAGFLGGNGLAPVPIEQPYVRPDPTVDTRPGQTVKLTLLMDPGGRVHVTAGVVPRKEITLMRDWTTHALNRIAPSFRAGPVLVDPVRVSLPKAIGLAPDQLWTRRDSPTTWRDDPILAATGEAELPDRSPVAQEGYLRARPPEDPAPSGGA